MIRFTVVCVTILAVLTTTASAGPPPPTLANIAVTHARPVAGHAFTGVTITKADAALENVLCSAKIHGMNLRAFKQSYYAQGVGLAAVTCRWGVPKAARGTLVTDVTVLTSEGSVTTPSISWRIR